VFEIVLSRDSRGMLCTRAGRDALLSVVFFRYVKMKKRIPFLRELVERFHITDNSIL